MIGRIKELRCLIRITNVYEYDEFLSPFLMLYSSYSFFIRNSYQPHGSYPLAQVHLQIPVEPLKLLHCLIKNDQHFVHIYFLCAIEMTFRTRGMSVHSAGSAIELFLCLHHVRNS